MDNKNDGQQKIYALGVHADTGLPLCKDAATIARMATSHADSKSKDPSHNAEVRLAKKKDLDSRRPKYGVSGDVECPNNLADAGWGVIFSSNATQEVKDALKPLIEYRGGQAKKLFRVFENGDGYNPGESCAEWLSRHNASMMAVDPLNGVPFYLLLVGSPEEIPFEFQYLLDINWGVGRLYFNSTNDYRAYVESVIDYEKSHTPANARNIGVFSTRHDLDVATQMFSDMVASPLALGDGQRPRLGEKYNFRLESFIGEEASGRKLASKEMLKNILRGKSPGGPPALLFTGSHGMCFRADDPLLLEAQGALVCQDWDGYARISPNDYFAASDVPSDAQVHGMIHFAFACYSNGCPQFDDFNKDKDSSPMLIAPKPTIANLPQRLLAHNRGGALASLGHIDQAWACSFTSTRGAPQVQGFRDVIARLLRGERLGLATDQFNIRWATLSSELSDVLYNKDRGIEVADWELANLWLARNDARNYIVLGDPAVRLPVESLR